MNSLWNVLFAATAVISSLVAARAETPEWVAPMREVHARFTGNPGTFAQFGDSITVTMAFWAPLEANPKNMTAPAAAAHASVAKYQKRECWREWKGPKFGSNGGMTVLWAKKNVDSWLERLNPEVAVIMFGSNDVTQFSVDVYRAGLQSVVERCLKNGTMPIVTTLPPRHGQLEKCEAFAKAAREVAAHFRVPLCDYFAEILKRRPDDWDGALPKFKDTAGGGYEVPTLIARDGVHPSNPARLVNDFSEEGLNTNGFTLRNYLTLLSYAEVIQHVCQPAPAKK